MQVKRSSFIDNTTSTFCYPFHLIHVSYKWHKSFVFLISACHRPGINTITFLPCSHSLFYRSSSHSMSTTERKKGNVNCAPHTFPRFRSPSVASDPWKWSLLLNNTAVHQHVCSERVSSGHARQTEGSIQPVIKHSSLLACIKRK